MTLPTPHGDKLKAILGNEKLPEVDRDHIKLALERYQAWRKSLMGLQSDEALEKGVQLLNEYRLFLDLEVIFDSPSDFLYRQKGQLKLDNSVVEEFLPILISRIFPDALSVFDLGPNSCFSSLYFTSTLRTVEGQPGAKLREKDHDFTIAKRVYLAVSFDRNLIKETDRLETRLGYLCAECKTNLDKTMFQEACATAHDVKTAVPGAKYLLLCEWLDMTPISTLGTDIDEVLILRKAKRLGSQVRSNFATSAGRKQWRDSYEQHLRKHPFAVDVFQRFVGHVRRLLEDRDPDETDVLARGYF